MGPIFAIDSDITADDSNLLSENNKIVFSSQNLEVSSYDSISETISHDDNMNNYSSEEDNGLLTSQYLSDDMLQVNDAKNTTLTGNDTELYYKNGTAFKVVLSDSEGSLLSNQSIIFNINGNNYTRTTNANGTASIAINLGPGSYDVTSFFRGSDGYEASSTTNLVKVLSTISGEDVEKYYRNDTQYYVTLVDGQGNLLNNTTVVFNINGVFYERKTNENGTAKLNINLSPGDYIITAINQNNGDRCSNDITVLTTIYGSDVVKYYRNDTQYYVNLVNGTGSPLANTSVSFNINGVFYTRTTNENGTAKLNINLGPNNYTITAMNTANNELHSNNIEVLPTIFAEDLIMDYRDGSKFAASVIDDQGNPLPKSNVTFNINGVFYNRTSDANGTSRLNINLNAGEYIITSTNYKGLSISNTITINRCNTTLEGNNAHIITGTDRNYTVKLIGENSNPIAYATINFNYNSRDVSAVTDANGEATIVISDIPEGKYNITYTFEGNGNCYPSKSNSTLIVANSTVILSANDLNMIYKDGSRFKVTLTDLDNKPLVNETISININGVKYNRTTNSDGVASIAINLIPGDYEVTYTHSEVDSIDYNEGSNTIVVSKIATNLSAEDINMDYGDDEAFIFKLTNSTGSPIEGVVVTLTINGVPYNRTTNSSGQSKLNIHLPVGYYEITTSLDSLYYNADSITNHILVNGSVITGEDLTMVAGTTVNYSVSLKDPYGNPINNTNVDFAYNGNVVSALTDSNGVASIAIGNLTKGSYLIVYNYTAGSNAGQSYITVVGTISISELVKASNEVNAYIEKNAKLPASVTIGDTTFTTAQYLYLLSEAIVGINNGDLSALSVLEVNDPTNPGAASNMGSLSSYVSVASSLLTSMDSGVTPNSVSTSLGDVGYDGIVYAFTRVLVYYGMLDQLPSSVSVKSLTLYTSQSVLDSANTISDLSAYLASSPNCQVTDSAIVALAEKLTAGLTNSLDKAVAIYNYVRDTVSYSFYYDTKYGAVGTLNSKTGNCVDHSHLLIALFRAADLPARYVHGTCVFSSGSTYGHVWTQVLIGNTWVVCDATSTRNSFGKVVNWNNYNYSLKGYYSSISF
ncbi:transglutaminase domain-containing protein [Methanobrevibacter sp.]|uniref:transglutaminase domain-containing protein n=1 Tax=Methanobrevibacter sp. TaxID=66852 RepID=UPI00388E2629